MFGLSRSHLFRHAFGASLAAAWLLAIAPSASAAPTLASSQPANNATGVSTAADLVFVFSEAMADVGAVPSVPPFLVGNLDTVPTSVADSLGCEWSADFKTLTCTPADPLPDNTTITWTLNPSGTIMAFTSAGGTPLATVTGSFSTGTAGGGGGGGNTAPALVSVTPAKGATAVSVSTTVTFVFDQAMSPNPMVGGAPPFVKGGLSWSATGLDATKFTYTWSPDSKSFTATYAGELPGNTTITWTINEAGALIPLANSNNQSVPTTTGSFTTGAGSGGGNPGCNSNTTDPHWGFYGIMRTFDFEQTSAADPTPKTSSAFNFGATLAGPAAGPAVTSGSVTLPNGSRSNLVALGFGGMFFLSDEKPSATALTTAYPGGNYVFRFLQTGSAERTVTMPLPAANPPAPKIGNYTAAQSIDATADFALTWNAFTGATAADIISLTIANGTTVVFQAPDPCVPRTLAPTATSIVIPANTLKANTIYSGILSFNKLGYSSTNAVPNMAGSSGASSTTMFTLRTGSGGPPPAAPARFTAWELLPNGHPRLTIQGTVGSTYTIQHAVPAFPNAAWQPAGTVTPGANGFGTFEDTQLTAPFPLIYRAVAQ